MQLVLASTSPYRCALLERLCIPFSVVNPEVSEARFAGEAPADMAMRLAEAKARAAAKRFADACIIGCDQVASCDGEILGKPGNYANAVRQLQFLSGREAVFDTALCVHNTETGIIAKRLVPSRVTFRTLDDGMIERYLRREQPYDCAASAKVETLGIALIKRLEGEDPNALIGLPLIALVDLLHEQGFDVL